MCPQNAQSSAGCLTFKSMPVTLGSLLNPLHFFSRGGSNLNEPPSGSVGVDGA